MRNCWLVIAVVCICLINRSAIGQVELLPPVSQYEVPPAQSAPLPADAESIPQVGEAIPPTGVLVPADELGEPPPIGLAWYNPAGWIGPYWDGSVELGLSGSEGNANARSLRTGFDMTRDTPRTQWDIDMVYAKNESNGAQTQHNALFNSNWDYKFASPQWTGYSKLGLEYDELRAFDLRFSLNGGLGYHFVKDPVRELRGRLGAGVSREFDSADDDWKPEANLGIDFEHKISDRQQIQFTSDYYPTWADFADYRLVSNASWELKLDTANQLSLKLSVIDRYDSTPDGAKRNDVDYAVLLLWSL